MKNLLAFISSLLILFSCNSKKEKTANYYINDKDSIGETYGMLISTNDLESTCFDYTDIGIKFSKCIDKDFYTIFRSTTDSNFKTSDGVSIGMSLNTVKIISKKQLVIEPDWAYYFPLKSGWNAAFMLDEKTDYQTIKDSTVAFIFKREKHEKEIPKFDSSNEKILQNIK